MSAVASPNYPVREAFPFMTAPVDVQAQCSEVASALAVTGPIKTAPSECRADPRPVAGVGLIESYQLPLQTRSVGSELYRGRSASYLDLSTLWVIS